MPCNSVPQSSGGIRSGYIRTNFEWRQGPDPAKYEFTQWSPFSKNTTYFDSLVTFQLSPDINDGVDLTLTNINVPEDEFEGVKAGWVSVLLALKAYADFGIDL